MNILHLALGTKNPHYSPIESAARETWFKNSPDNVKTIFMYGDSSKIFWDEDSSFYVNKPESLETCFYKTISAFEVFLDSEFDYIFRSNNTGYFDLNLLSKFVEDKPKENFYCGCVGELYGNLFASGSGYFISKDLVKKVVDNRETLYNYQMPGWYDDVIIGKFITQFLKIDIDPSAKRLDITYNDINDDLDMSHYHYRILDHGDAKSIYCIHELKCKNQ